MTLRDYGADIACPECRTQVHITPKQLQSELQIAFICARCGSEVIHENAVARDIADRMETIRRGLGKIRI
ncbi:MAG: hypothetical protein JWM91_581 [Rhodospirillales bacterium]|nr:hypothetical protein [Rhodospirillales bacterium]